MYLRDQERLLLNSFTNPVKYFKIGVFQNFALPCIKVRAYSVERAFTRAMVVLIRLIMRNVPAVREGMHIQPIHSEGRDYSAGADLSQISRTLYSLVPLISS